jgi:uncharacterized protein
VDFGAVVDVGLSDSGLIHISQLSAGYVRDPHDVVAVGDQVRAWVSSIDQQRRRVALTMIAPGTERPQPVKQRRGGRRRQDEASQPRPQAQPAAASARAPAERGSAPPRRGGKPRHDRRGPPQRPERTAAYEKRAPKQKVPITKEMEEGKAYLRSFGDLLQFQQKKKEPKHDDPQPGDQTHPPENPNGASP